MQDGAGCHAGKETMLAAAQAAGKSEVLAQYAQDYPLPEGYVRHHQVTDEGVAIEPILMFAPDFTLFDADGRPWDGRVPSSLAITCAVPVCIVGRLGLGGAQRIQPLRRKKNKRPSATSAIASSVSG